MLSLIGHEEDSEDSLSQTMSNKIERRLILSNLMQTIIYLGYYATQALCRLPKAESQLYVGSQAINAEIVKQ